MLRARRLWAANTRTMYCRDVCAKIKVQVDFSLGLIACSCTVQNTSTGMAVRCPSNCLGLILRNSIEFNEAPMPMPVLTRAPTVPRPSQAQQNSPTIYLQVAPCLKHVGLSEQEFTSHCSTRSPPKKGVEKKKVLERAAERQVSPCNSFQWRLSIDKYFFWGIIFAFLL